MAKAKKASKKAPKAKQSVAAFMKADAAADKKLMAKYAKKK